MSLSSSSIRISWEKPAVETNVNLLDYYICYKGESTKEICQSTSDLTYSIIGLNPKTTYEIGVRSNTSIGNSEYRNISWTTYEGKIK